MTIKKFNNTMPTIGERVMIDDSAVVIGDVHIGNDSAIWPTVVVRGDMHSIHIGHNTNIQDGSVLHVTHASEKTHPDGYPLTIGNHVTVGHQVILHGCTIDDYCLIGMGSLIMDGAHVPSDIIIGARTLVPPGKKLESGYLYIGSPCLQKRRLTEEELSFIRYSAQNYTKLKDKYLNDCQ